MKKILFLVLICFLSVIAFAQPKPGSQAPDIPKDAIWLSKDKPTFANGELKGKVVLVDFWEYTCINCIRTFPHLKKLYARYHKYGFEIIGVHKGEFEFAAKRADYVRRAYKRFKLPYPAIADVKDEIWNAYQSYSWPNSFLIDRNGAVQLNHEGEGNYAELEEKIQELLKQQHPEYDFSKFKIAPDVDVSAPKCGPDVTEETYIGYERGSSWGGKIANPEGFHKGKVVDYKSTDKRVKRGFFAEGKWRNRPDDFESVAASTPDSVAYIGINYTAADVFPVLDRGAKHPVQLVVTRDGKPIPEAVRGQDITVNAKGETVITIDESRMYYCITKEDDQKHELRFYPQEAGARICSFTFGNKCQADFDRL
ncbi:MAG TPA: redoxin domain-containing protein [Candidatus Kapabacteria bacterium]|nr:redoxin domain-containing protein [Candidatus Kapabacteria bacterium]